jgi:CheY-like chemotaxis protein
MHGGTVRVASEGEGRGATFTLVLPLSHSRKVDSSRGPDEKPCLTRPISEHYFATLFGLKVMVVEDEADTREVVSLLLERSGAEVRACASAAEAVESIQKWKPDVLVADIGMPGENGYEMIGRIRSLAPERGGNVPAMALSAYARAEDKKRSLEAGFQMHVTKPVEPVELIATIASLAGQVAGEKQ